MQPSFTRRLCTCLLSLRATNYPITFRTLRGQTAPQRRTSHNGRKAEAEADLGTVLDGLSGLCCRSFEFLDETVVDVRGMLFFKLVLHTDRQGGRTIDGIDRPTEGGVGRIGCFNDFSRLSKVSW